MSLFPQYDYKHVVYINNKTKVTIVCPNHGEFRIRPGALLGGTKCRACSNNSTTVEFIAKAVAIYGSKYTYERSRYTDSKARITVTCSIHGDIITTPNAFLDGHGCMRCHTTGMILTTDDFVDRAQKLKLGNYDYSRTIYVKSLRNIEILCRTCGKYFWQLPHNHLNRCGCPHCNQSREQREIAAFISQYATVRPNARDVITPFEIDVYADSHKLGVEYHGLYWHSYDSLETKTERLRHQAKYLAAKAIGVTLLQFFGHEWPSKRNIIESMILNKLRLTATLLSARDYKVETLSDDEVRLFYNQSHLYGHRSAKLHFGLRDGRQILCCMSFSPLTKVGISWELIRLATAPTIVVRGGASKLLNRFKATITNCKRLTTFADLRYSDGDLYRTIGFDDIGMISPNYFYYRSGCVLSRTQCQKNKLHKLLDVYDHKLSEAQNMFNNRFRRCWNAGHRKFVLVM